MTCVSPGSANGAFGTIHCEQSAFQLALWLRQHFALFFTSVSGGAGDNEWHNEFGKLSQRIAPGATMGWAIPKACLWFEGKRRVSGADELAGVLNLEVACTA